MNISVPALLFLAAPAVLVAMVYALLKSRPIWARRLMSLTLVVVWLAALVFWMSYTQQDNDVDLMVHGITAAALSIAALIASLVTVFLWRRL